MIDWGGLGFLVMQFFGHLTLRSVTLQAVTTC